MKKLVTPAEPWGALRHLTTARIALGRSGASLPTSEVLKLSLAHAQARDAVQLELDVQTLVDELERDGWPEPLAVENQAADRVTYIMRPDLGRTLRPDHAGMLAMQASQAPDLVIVIADGLSSIGIRDNAVALVGAIRAVLPEDTRLCPLVVARNARVALGDDIATRLKARMVAVVIGERPGLSSPDSLGIYLTYAPRIGCSDAERNCISNVRPGGQTFADAAKRLVWLIGEAQRTGATGVQLKDASGMLLVDDGTAANPPPLTGEGADRAS